MGESRTPVETRRFRVAGLDDADGAARTEQALMSVPGVHRAMADFEHQLVIVRTADYVTDDALAEAVEGAGYTLLARQATASAPGHAVIDDIAPPVAPDDAAPSRDTPSQSALSRRWTWNRGSIWQNLWFYVPRAAAGAIAFSILLTLVYRILPVPTTMLMLGEGVLGGQSISRHWVSLDEISPHLIRSVIASEDADFCRHWGFDFKGMQDALKDAERGGRLRGASTISQQTAKNVFLWSGRSWLRKGLEAWFTVLIEAFWPKRRIMEVYLNVIEWGPGVFGADAAAQKWFRKPAAKLTRLEAARLAAILPNPKRYRANPPGPYVNGRGYTISARAQSVDLNGSDRCARP